MADATSNESGEIDFRPYLQSTSQHYQQWCTLYTLTDAEGKEELKHQAVTWDASFDFDLTVQVVQKQSAPEAEEPGPDGSSPQGKIEQLPVLEGISKYADDCVLLVGRPGLGKSTALARLLLEECSSAAETDREQPEQIPVLVELRFWQTSIVDLIRNFFGRHGLYLNRSQTEHLLFHNRLLLVDGLNELPSEAARQDVAKLPRDYPNVSAIFTTRDLNLGEDFGIEKKLEMQSLTTAQMQDFVRSHLEDRAELTAVGRSVAGIWEDTSAAVDAV